MRIQLRFPDLFALTPFSGWNGFHRSFDSEKKESTEWILTYDLFFDDVYDRVKGAGIELLVGVAYNNSSTSEEDLKTIGDYLALLIVLDEITDIQDAEGAATTRDAFIKGLTCSSGEDMSPIVQCAHDFMQRLTGIPENLRKRFIGHCSSYITATAEESRLRNKKSKLGSINEYLLIRRDNSAVICCFDLIEMSLGIELPEEVFEDPDFMKVYYAAVDMICWSNDIYSYPKEYKRSIETINAVTVAMNERNTSLQEAVDWVAKSYHEFGEIMNIHRQKIKSFGLKVDEDIQKFIDGMEQWIWGNLEWYFRCGRFFGEKADEVRCSGIFEFARRTDDTASEREN